MFGRLGDSLKRRLLDIAYVAFRPRQEAENEFAVTGDPLKHSFFRHRLSRNLGWPGDKKMDRKARSPLEKKHSRKSPCRILGRPGGRK
jgi:hypothetical protein